MARLPSGLVTKREAIEGDDKRSEESCDGDLSTPITAFPSSKTKTKDSSWQIIIVQANTGARSHSKAAPLQTMITYGDKKEYTPVVNAKDPLWNFWTQLPDVGGTEAMVFSLLERDDTTGKITVKGEARLDLWKFRRIGHKSFELWEALRNSTEGGGGLSAVGPHAPGLLHLTVTYCPAHLGEDVEDGDCQLCTNIGIFGCSIS